MDVNSKGVVYIVVDFINMTCTNMSVNVNLNINTNHVKAEVAQGAMDVRQNIEPVLDLRLYSVGEVDMSESGNSSDYPLCPTELSSCRVVYISAGCCLMDFSFPSGEQTDHRGHVRWTGCMCEVLQACTLWGCVRTMPCHCLTG